MRLPHLVTAAAAALSGVATSLALASPATASTIYNDPADIRHGADLRSMLVRKTPASLVVVTVHRDLTPSWKKPSSIAVYLDTDPETDGPEYALLGGLFDGTDYQLVHTTGIGRSTFGKPVRGAYSMRLDYKLDTVRLRFAKETLGNPESVRIAVRASGSNTADHNRTQVDWLGKDRSFTDAIPLS